MAMRDQGGAMIFQRKRRRRAQRRSPINIDLLRTPGHTVREQLEDAGTDLTLDSVSLPALRQSASSQLLL